MITPSLPTFCIAFEIMSPIDFSPFAEIVPTCATSSLVFTFFELVFNLSITNSTALSIPRFRSIGFIPAVTYFNPSLTIA